METRAWIWYTFSCDIFIIISTKLVTLLPLIIMMILLLNFCKCDLFLVPFNFHSISFFGPRKVLKSLRLLLQYTIVSCTYNSISRQYQRWYPLSLVCIVCNWRLVDFWQYFVVCSRSNFNHNLISLISNNNNDNQHFIQVWFFDSLIWKLFKIIIKICPISTVKDIFVSMVPLIHCISLMKRKYSKHCHNTELSKNCICQKNRAQQKKVVN